MSFIETAVNAAKNAAQSVGTELLNDAKAAASKAMASPGQVKEIASDFVADAKQTIVEAVMGKTENADELTLRVKDSSGAVVYEGPIAGDQNILDECGEKGVDLPFSCHAGACMSCAAQVTCGRDLLDHQKFGQQYIETDEDTILTCIAAPKTNAKGTIELQMLM